MGHEMCGAVKATVDSASGAALGPNAEYLLKSIRPAASRVANQPAESRLRLAILENVEESINTIIGSSATLRQLSEANKLLMVGAYYELASGRVLFSQPVAVPPQRSAPPVSRSTEAHGASSPRAAAASSTPAAASAAPPTPSTSGAAPPAAPPAAAASSSAKPAAPSSSSAKPAAAAPKPAAGAAPATASATPIKPASAPPKSAPVPGPVSVSVPVSSSH
jgi:hypothetical protein